MNEKTFSIFVSKPVTGYKLTYYSINTSVTTYYTAYVTYTDGTVETISVARGLLATNGTKITLDNIVSIYSSDSTPNSISGSYTGTGTKTDPINLLSDCTVSWAITPPSPGYAGQSIY